MIFSTPLDRALHENDMKTMDFWRHVNKLIKKKNGSGIHYTSIYKFRNGDRVPSRFVAPFLVKALDGKISRAELLYPDEYI